MGGARRRLESRRRTGTDGLMGGTNGLLGNLNVYVRIACVCPGVSMCTSVLGSRFQEHDTLISRSRSTLTTLSLSHILAGEASLDFPL